MKPPPDGYTDHLVILRNNMFLGLRINEGTRRQLELDWTAMRKHTKAASYPALDAENKPIRLYLRFSDVFAITSGGLLPKLGYYEYSPAQFMKQAAQSKYHTFPERDDDSAANSSEIPAA